VEWSYLNTDMCNFESSQKDESRIQLSNSSKHYRNRWAFYCDCYFRETYTSVVLKRVSLGSPREEFLSSWGKFVPGRIWGGKISSLIANSGDYIASTGTDCQARAQVRSSQNTTICTRVYSALWNLAKATSSWNMQNLVSLLKDPQKIFDSQ